MNGLFITGTDTDVGKTEVVCRIVRSLRAGSGSVGAYKPVCSGFDDELNGWSDQMRLSAALDGAYPDELICPQRWRAACAPNVAARLERKAVDDAALLAGVHAWDGIVETLIVEGVGGWLCPLSDEQTVADLATSIGFPVVVVVPEKLGAVNQTLLTIEAIQRRGLKCMGVVMNQVDAENDGTMSYNRLEIARISGVPILGELGHGSSSELRDIATSETIQWQGVIAAAANPS